jgi:hypothetical protein
MAVKVSLKDALDRPLTVDANEFLSDLVGREVELKLVSSRQYFFLNLFTSVVLKVLAYVLPFFHVSYQMNYSKILLI